MWPSPVRERPSVARPFPHRSGREIDPPQAANAVGELDPGPAFLDPIPDSRMDRCPRASPHSQGRE
jgi:hypothetical protein